MGIFPLVEVVSKSYFLIEICAFLHVNQILDFIVCSLFFPHTILNKIFQIFGKIAIDYLKVFFHSVYFHVASMYNVGTSLSPKV